MHFPRRQPFRTTSNYVLAAATEVVAGPLRFGARLVAPERPVPPSQWKRVLILGDVHLGDLLYRTCSFPELKAGLPHCQFYYLTAEGEADVLRGNPDLDGTIPLRGSKSDSALDLKAGALEELRERRFDAVLCSNAVRGWPELFLALKLRIPNRVAYGHRGLSGLVTHPVIPQFPQPFPGYFRDMVAAVTGCTPDWPLRPRIYPDARERAEAEKLWSDLKLNGAEPVLACFVKSRQANGSWPVGWFGEVMRIVQKRSRCRIVLCGTAADRPELERIRQQFELLAVLNPGLLSVMCLASFLEKCSLVLTQDSGPRHIANAAGIPVLFLRNTFADAVETGAYCDTETDLAPPTLSRTILNPRDAFIHLPPEKGAEAVQLKIKS